MLSYRHSYHAGNFADLLKHIIQVEILEHLVKKDKPFEYIDTHAGAGLYNLTSAHADKNPEYKDGIAKLKTAEWPELSQYLTLIKHFNPQQELKLYPGSPAIGSHYLRAKDRAWLFELHPSDSQKLQQHYAKDKRVRVHNEDGFQGLLGLVPPTARRGLVLIDPSYEIKNDYGRVFDVVKKAYNKFPTGSYAIWYPVVERQRINQLETQFKRSGIKNIQLFELGLEKDSEQHGMTASGMIVINPPWTLMEKMKTLLPKLAHALDKKREAFCRCEVLAGE